MQRVSGIGGVFFRAQDPERLSAWYAAHLGVDPAPESYEVTSWWQQAGPTVFNAISPDSAHFGDPARAWAVNFRVTDLDAMVRHLRAAGVDVVVDVGDVPQRTVRRLVRPRGQPRAAVGARGRRPARPGLAVTEDDP